MPGASVHASHTTRTSDASTYDEVCVDCGATDAPGGGLAAPCPNPRPLPDAASATAAPCGADVATPTIADEVGARVERFNQNRRMDALREYARIFHANAVAKGFVPEGGHRPVPEIVALLHSEVSEMLECWRDNQPFLWTGEVSGGEGRIIFGEGTAPALIASTGKPEGIAAEAADVFIRLLQSCEELGIDLAQAVEAKWRYNATRPHRHGGKAA